MASKSAFTEIKERSDKYVEEGYVSGMPAVIYLILNAVLCSIYFAIKLIMYLEDDPHYLSTINDDFQRQGFNEFYNARIILLVTIFGHSFMNIKQVCTLYLVHITPIYTNKQMCFL